MSPRARREIASIFERIRILMEYQCLPYIMRHEYYNRSPYKGMFITPGPLVQPTQLSQEEELPAVLRGQRSDQFRFPLHV